MPKNKTHSGAKKRFKITGTGKVMRQQTGLRQRRSKKVRSRQTPDDAAARAGSDAGGKKRGCRPIDGAGPTAGKFMDCTIGKSATW